MLANSGLEANVERLSTAPRRGLVATRHLFLFSSEKSPSKAFNKTTGQVLEATILLQQNHILTNTIFNRNSKRSPCCKYILAKGKQSRNSIARTLTLIVLTRLAVVLATSLADWTNCLLATGLDVLDEARRHALQRAEVCFATIVAAERT